MALGTPLANPRPQYLQPGSQFQQAFQFGQANFGNLQQAGLNQRRQSLLQQRQNLANQFAASGRHLRSQIGNLQQQQDVRGNIIGISRGEIPGQLQRLAQQGRIQRRALTGGLGTIDQLRDLNLRMKALAQAGFRTEVEGLNLGRASTRTRSEEEERRFTSESIGRGAVGASGTRAGLEFIGTELEQALQGFDIKQKQARQALEGQFLGLKKERVNLAQQRRTLLSDFQLSQLNRKDQRAQLKARDRILGEQARLVGLQKDELAIRLSRGLEQINLDRTVSVGQIMDALGSNNLQQAALGRQLAEFAMSNAQFFPGRPESQVTALGRRGYTPAEVSAGFGS